MTVIWKKGNTNSKGVNKFLKNGTSHTPLTRLIEKLDNSQKAIKLIGINGEIIIYNKDDKQSVENILTSFEIDIENNSICLSKCGMGLNASIIGELDENYGYALIISKPTPENLNITFIYIEETNNGLELKYHTIINNARWL